MSDGLNKEYGSGQYRMHRNLRDAFGSQRLDTANGAPVQTQLDTMSFFAKPRRKTNWFPVVRFLVYSAAALVVATMWWQP